ncbi:PEPxxWA-CTERM sorting domain-containing protein [Sandaracinobacter neustonicus]|nr:PEPxxWA-CTERM sorting domain-containing protein [Sandaracinobacter neustonicus]
MKRIAKQSIVALGLLATLGATPAAAVTISNPTNTHDLGYLSGSLTGGNQTQFLGQTFTAPVTGELTNFQFTLNSSTLQSLYGVVYVWNGSAPTTEVWRSAITPGTAGLVSFNPTGVTLTQGTTYVAFLSTYGLEGNSGLASMGTCLTFVGCNSNLIPNLGTLIIGNILGDGPVFSPIVNNSRDATFSVSIAEAAVPEPATWAMLIIGFGTVGMAARRRRVGAAQ